MKKILTVILVAIMYLNVTSCATIVGGQVTTYQRTKPKAGEPQREIKMVPLLFDIFFWGGAGLIVDFATGAIYKNQPASK
ncbi:MAG: hypothetical protein RI940_1588 [Bacteroidota bacterium]|jgi:hypothetical protein